MMSRFQHDRILGRRTFLGWLGGLVAVTAVAENVEAEEASEDSSSLTPISVTAINHTKIRVSNPARSLEWYQGLFGLPIVARQGKTVVLRIGEGPQFLAIDGKSTKKPGIAHMGLAVHRFDAQHVLQRLAAHAKDSKDPFKARVQTRKSDSGGDASETEELFLEDPDGITIQLQGESFCGGHGKLGNQYSDKLEPAPKPGLLQLRDYNHFTTFVNDQARSVAFYRQRFGLPIDTWQGSMPLLRVGKGNQFLAFVGVGGRQNFRPFIHHVCFSVDEFDPKKILNSLEEFGIKRRETAGPTRPLQSYVTMRMPNRGGAKRGTPELYFSDPDGILLQIQDVRYSGGSGFLGDVRGKK